MLITACYAFFHSQLRYGITLSVLVGIQKCVHLAKKLELLRMFLIKRVVYQYLNNLRQLPCQIYIYCCLADTYVSGQSIHCHTTRKKYFLEF